MDIRGLIEAPTVQHHAGLTNPVEVGQLLRDIDADTGRRQTVLAMGLGTLTFARPKELRQAERSAFDLEAGEWRVARTIMKMKVEHVIPLSRQAIEIVREALALSKGSRWLFPCLGNPERPMSENTINDALRRMGYSNDEMTGQGVRTMASTLLNEQGWPADAIEKQLSHIEENEVRGAYNQAKYLPVRRRMMQFWADYLDELRRGNTASVKDFEAIAASHCGPRAIEQTLRTERTPPPMTNATLLPNNSPEFVSCFRFSIGASFQIENIQMLPLPKTDAAALTGSDSSEDAEVERGRRTNGTFASDYLPV